jgi:hypothetical protein
LKLHSFLYLLLKDHITVGVAEELLREVNSHSELIPLSNSHLKAYIDDMLKELLTSDGIHVTSRAELSTVEELSTVDDFPPLVDPIPPMPKETVTVIEPEPAAAPKLLTRINDKQWSALLGFGISHGMTIDAIGKFIRERYGVESIRLLPADKFSEAMDALVGRQATPGEPEAETPNNGDRISTKQWVKLLDAGNYAGLPGGPDGTEAFIRERYGVKVRDLKASQFDEALDAIRAMA